MSVSLKLCSGSWGFPAEHSLEPLCPPEAVYTTHSSQSQPKLGLDSSQDCLPAEAGLHCHPTTDPPSSHRRLPVTAEPLPVTTDPPFQSPQTPFQSPQRARVLTPPHLIGHLIYFDIFQSAGDQTQGLTCVRPASQPLACSHRVGASGAVTAHASCLLIE